MSHNDLATIRPDNLGEHLRTQVQSCVAVDFDDAIMPIVSIDGCEAGPVVLITGGIHGDELEGPTLVAEFARTIDRASLRGRLILIPAVSPLGLAARTRHCPLDGLDPNRSFPGSRSGTITERISAAISEAILPLVDMVYDIHAGGVDDAIMPSVIIHPRGDPEQMRASLAAMLAFDAPAALIAWEDGSHTMFDGEVERQGKVFGCAEIGSFGAISTDMLAIGRRGIRNLLSYAGSVNGLTVPARIDRRLLLALDADHMLVMPEAGYFVPAVELGTAVRTGDVVGEIVDLHRPLNLPKQLYAPRDGVVFICAAGGYEPIGRNLMMIVEEVETAETMYARGLRAARGTSSLNSLEESQ